MRKLWVSLIFIGCFASTVTWADDNISQIPVIINNNTKYVVVIGHPSKIPNRLASNSIQCCTYIKPQAQKVNIGIIGAYWNFYNRTSWAHGDWSDFTDKLNIFVELQNSYFGPKVPGGGNITIEGQLGGPLWSLTTDAPKFKVDLRDAPRPPANPYVAHKPIVIDINNA